MFVCLEVTHPTSSPCLLLSRPHGNFHSGESRTLQPRSVLSLPDPIRARGSPLSNSNSPVTVCIRVSFTNPGIMNSESMVEDRQGLCGECRTVNRRKVGRACATCESWYHLTCVQLTREQSRNIPRWMCSGCRGVAPVVVEARTDNPEHYITSCRARARVLKIVPRGALIAAADGLRQEIDRAVQEGTHTAWVRLLCFSYWAIRHPGAKQGEDRRCVSLATRVKRQVTEFLCSAGLPDPGQLPEVTPRENDSAVSEQRLRGSVSTKFAEGDIRGAVRLLSSAEAQAPEDENTYALLKGKHPPSPSDLSMPAPPEDGLHTPAVCGEEDVRRALASFRPGSAGGPDGIRPGHLQTLTSPKAAEAGSRLLTSLTRLINLVLEGSVPEFVRAIFYGAHLCALNKKDGGIRPIAVGCTLRRLAVKVGIRPLADRLGESLRPIQVGVATRGGCEAAAHAARQYLGRDAHRRVLFKLDMANAFNSLRRDVFLRIARERTREMYKSLWQAYSEPSTLFYGSRFIRSSTGLQQGDPFGPSLFSLGIDEVAKKISAEFNVWYLDDGTIGDKPEKVLDCVRTLVADLGQVGLEVNQGKCELIILNHSSEERIETEGMFRDLFPDLTVVEPSCSILLGAPLSEEGITSAMTEKREGLERMVARLKLIENHQAFSLLKNCFAIPKLMYVMRASPAYKQEDELTKFDEILERALATVTNVRFDNNSLVQACLPVKMGGLGIRLSKDLALPAFISSMHSVSHLVEAIFQNAQHLADNDGARDAVDLWRRENGGEAAEISVKESQRMWDMPGLEKKWKNLVGMADQTSKARLLAASVRESGLWLNALPSSAVGTLMDPESFRVAVALRVGADVCRPHVCRCGRNMDARGLHALSCKFSAGRGPRHTALNETVRRALRSAGIPSTLEPVGIDRGDGKRPDGITVFPFSRGRYLVWDATCTDTYAETNLNGSAVSPGSAARKAEERKRSKYPDMVARYRFEPIAVETTGVYGNSTEALISEIGRRISEVTGDRRETRWLEERIGIAVQLGNAHSILASVRERFDITWGGAR